MDLEDPTHALILFLIILTVLFIGFYGLGWTVLWLPTMVSMIVASILLWPNEERRDHPDRIRRELP